VLPPSLAGVFSSVLLIRG